MRAEETVISTATIRSPMSYAGSTCWLKLRTLTPEFFCNRQPCRYLGLWLECACSGFDTELMTELFCICH